MARLNIERQKELEPKRMQFARKAIEGLGYSILSETDNELQFLYKSTYVYFFPYTGWHTGKSIIDGRGIDKLLKQIAVK